MKTFWNTRRTIHFSAIKATFVCVPKGRVVIGTRSACTCVHYDQYELISVYLGPLRPLASHTASTDPCYLISVTGPSKKPSVPRRARRNLFCSVLIGHQCTSYFNMIARVLIPERYFYPSGILMMKSCKWARHYGKQDGHIMYIGHILFGRLIPWFIINFPAIH